MDTSPFDDACATAIDATYSQFGVLASYIVNGGAVAEVTILVDDRSRMSMDKQGSRGRVHVLRGSVRVSEVEELGRGDTIQLDGEDIIYRVVPSSVSNDGLEWTFEASAEASNTVGDVRTMPDR